MLGQFYQQLQDALTGAERALALFDTKTKIPIKPESPQLPLIKGEVIFDHIYFEYEKINQYMISFHYMFQQVKL